MIKSFSIYVTMSIYQAFLVFLLIAFFSHSMEIELFGKYNLYMAIIPFLFNIIFLGATGSVSIHFHKVSQIKFKFYIGQILFYILPFSFFISLAIYLLFGSIIANIFLLNKNILFLLIFITLFQIIPQVMLTFYQTSNQAIKYLWLNSLYLTSNFIASILAYLAYETLYMVFLSLLIVSFMFTIYIYLILHKKKMFYIKFKKNIFIDILSYGTPLIVHTIGMALLFISDRFFISYYLGNKEVGLYSVAIQLSMIILILVNSFASAWGAYLFKELKISKNIVSKKLVMPIYIYMTFFIALPFLLYFVQEIILSIFFDIKYQASMKYVFIISIGYSILGIWKIFNPFLFYLQKTILISVMTFIALIINLILNYLLIQIYGGVGVAYGTTIAMLFLSAINMYYANKLYNLSSV